MDLILPPEPPHPTLTDLPSNDTEPPPVDEEFGTVSFPEAIAAGDAERAFGEALDSLAAAFVRCEALGMSFARALDAMAEGGAP